MMELNFWQKHNRVIKSIVVGLGCALVSAFVYRVFRRVFRIEFSVFFVLIGYFIGVSIAKYGRGVTRIHSIIGALCALLCFLLIDSYSIESMLNVQYWFLYTMRYIQAIYSLQWQFIMALLFRILGLYYAYHYAKVEW